MEIKPKSSANSCYTTTCVHEKAFTNSSGLRSGESTGGDNLIEEENLDNNQEGGDPEVVHVKQCMQYKHSHLEIHLPKKLPCSDTGNNNTLNSEADQEEKNIRKDQSSKLMESYLPCSVPSTGSQEVGDELIKREPSSSSSTELQTEEDEVHNIELFGCCSKQPKVLTSFSSSIGMAIFFEVSDCSDFIVGMFPNPDDQSVIELKNRRLTSKEVSTPNSSMSSSQTLIPSLSQTDDILIENLNPTKSSCTSQDDVEELSTEEIKELRRFYSDLSNITCCMRMRCKWKDFLMNWCLEQSIPTKILYQNPSYNSTTFLAIFSSLFSQTSDMDVNYKVEVDLSQDVDVGIHQSKIGIKDTQGVISYLRTSEWYELSQICIPLLPEIDINTLVYNSEDLMMNEEEVKRQRMLLTEIDNFKKEEEKGEEECLQIFIEDGSVETINVNDQIIIENEALRPRTSNHHIQLPLNYDHPSIQRTLNDFPCSSSSSSSSSISFRRAVIIHQSPPPKESPINKKVRRRRRRGGTLNSNKPIALSSSFNEEHVAHIEKFTLFFYPFDYGRSSMSITVRSTDLERLLPPPDKCPQGTDLEKEMMGEDVDESAITNLLEEMFEEGDELNDTLIEFYLAYSRFQGSIFSIDQKYREEPDPKGEMFKIICDEHKLSDDPYYYTFSTHFYSTITRLVKSIEIEEFDTKPVLLNLFLPHIFFLLADRNHLKGLNLGLKILIQ